MSAKQLVVAKSADKDFLKLPKKIQSRVIEAYIKLKDNPLAGEKLHGVLRGQYKLRIGDYRIVYEYDSNERTVFVLKIEHRRGVYK